MTESIYKRLARHFDRIPNGFPETDSGVELKLLTKLFTPREAELACRLWINPRDAASVAREIGLDENETYNTLKGMVRKGLITGERGEGKLAFKLIPFIVGFYERQNGEIDTEFAEYFEQYYREALYKIMTIHPSVHRVIPVEQSIPFNIEVMPYERASYYLDNAKSWGVLKCICRVQKQLVGKGCGHTLENCLVFTERANAFKKTEAIRAITREEAQKILEDADREGLVHSTHNTRQGINYICNCCACSCGVMRGISEYGSLDAMARSDFYAEVDPDLCTGCGLCVDRCQFKAVKLKDELCSIERLRCFGCGLCITACPSGALRLRQKPAGRIEPPAETEVEWMKKRAKSRKMKFSPDTPIISS